MKVFVTGVNGQLGNDVMHELMKRGHDAVGSGTRASSVFDRYIQADITDATQIKEAIRSEKPDAVIHCAAWTAVDAAEEEANRQKVMAINAGGTGNIAEACKEIDSKMVYISTDYVFGGQGSEAWQPDGENFHPINVYGQSKLDGELAVFSILQKYFIVRTAWVFGKNGKNFVATMLSLADKGLSELRVVDDQIGTPTYTYDLARLLVDMIETEKYGYYHATNEGGYISWADFSKEIFNQTKRAVTVHRVSTAEYGQNKAKRPLNSRLDKSKLITNGFEPLPNWKDALTRYLKEIGE